MTNCFSVRVPYNAEISYKSFAQGVKIAIPRIDEDGKYITFEFWKKSVLVMFYYFQRTHKIYRCYVVAPWKEGDVSEPIRLPGVNQPLKLICKLKGKGFWNLRRAIYILTKDNPYKVLCLPQMFWYRLCFLSQYGKARRSDILNLYYSYLPKEAARGK